MNLGLKNGIITMIVDSLSLAEGHAVIDDRNSDVLVNAGGSHLHFGIERPHSQNALSESDPAATGGVATILGYFGTGQDYHLLTRSSSRAGQ